MGINLGQGLAAFAGGALDRAKEIDKEVADRVKTLKASKPDELLKSRYKKEYEKFDKEQAILAEVTSAGGPNTEPGQMALGGFGTNTDEYRKQLAVDPTLYFEMRDAPTAPKYTPTDYNLNGPNTIQRLWARATGDDETADKGEIEATAGTTTSFERGAGKKQTPEGRERMNTWRRNIPSSDKKLDVEKKTAYYYSQYKNPKLFPELVNVSNDIKERIAFTMATKAIDLNRDGLQVDIYKETLNALNVFKTGDQDTSPPSTDVKLSDTNIPQATRIALKKEQEALKVAAEQLKVKTNQEARQRVNTQAYKVTAIDIDNAGNALKASTFTTYANPEDKIGTNISFMDEVSAEDKNAMELSVAGDVNAIVAQARISPAAASTLAVDIAKTGLVYDSDIFGPDIIGNNFTFGNPKVSWAEVLSTYNRYKPKRPNTTYDEVLKKLLEDKGL